MPAQTDWSLAAYIAHNETLRAQQAAAEATIQTLRDRALELQAREYERRLESLNHENARIATAANQSVSRELFDARIGPIESYIALAQGRGAGADNSRAMIAWVVALLASLIAIGSFVFITLRTPAQPVNYAPMAPGTLVPTPGAPMVPK